MSPCQYLPYKALKYSSANWTFINWTSKLYKCSYYLFFFHSNHFCLKLVSRRKINKQYVQTIFNILAKLGHFYLIDIKYNYIVSFQKNVLICSAKSAFPNESRVLIENSTGTKTSITVSDMNKPQHFIIPKLVIYGRMQKFSTCT